MKYEFDWRAYEKGASTVRVAADGQEYILKILSNAFQILKEPAVKGRGRLMATINVPDLRPHTVEDAFIAHLQTCIYKIRCYRRDGSLSHEMFYRTLKEAETERTRWGRHIGLRPEPSLDFAYYPTIWSQGSDGWIRMPDY